MVSALVIPMFILQEKGKSDEAGYDNQLDYDNLHQ